MQTTKRVYLSVINIFIALTVCALIATAYLTLAKATITLPGERERFSNTATITIASSETADALPGTIVTREYTETGTFPVGSVTTTADKAGGVVTIVNNYSRSQSLVKTTRLMDAEGRIFRITEAVNVPAGKTVQVFAEADQTGDQYLIPKAKFTIPGLWEGIQDQIYAESSQPMTYERRGSAIVTEEIVQNAVTELLEALTTRALADFQKDYPEFQDLAREQLYSKATTIEADPFIAKEASSVTVTITKKLSAVATDQSKLQLLLEEKLKSQLPRPEAYIETIPDTMTYTIATLDTESGTAQLETQLDAWIHSDAAVPSLDLSELTGTTKSAAYAYLRAQGITDATITTFPSFAPTLPFLKSHIELQAK